jgi:hypothetical protein
VVVPGVTYRLQALVITAQAKLCTAVSTPLAEHLVGDVALFFIPAITVTVVVVVDVDVDVLVEVRVVVEAGAVTKHGGEGTVTVVEEDGPVFVTVGVLSVMGTSE